MPPEACAAASVSDHPRRRADGRHDGIVGATVVTLGLLTLPTLLRRKYDKGLACGSSAPPARWAKSSRRV